MNELTSFCKDLKKDFIPKIRDPKKPVKTAEMRCKDKSTIKRKGLFDA